MYECTIGMGYNLYLLYANEIYILVCRYQCYLVSMVVVFIGHFYIYVAIINSCCI